MCIRPALAALCLLAVAEPAQAGLILRIEGNKSVGEVASPFTVDAQQVKENEFGPPIAFRCALSGDCALDLPAGSWVLSSGDDRIYALPVSTTITDGASAPVLPFLVRRAARISGRIKEPRAISVLSMRFRGEPKGAMSGRARCRVEDDLFTCILPEGQWDLRLAVARHVPHYLWRVDARPDKTSDLGVVAFRRGASLAGRVEVEKGVKLRRPEDLRVTLAPAAAFRTADEEIRASRTVRPRKTGFFQFEGLPAGDYTLLATADGAAAEPQVVRIVADAEAELRAPLVVARPRAITVTVIPMWEAPGRPWRIRLRRQTELGRFTAVRESAADAAGAWRHDAVWPGRYELSVMDTAGGTWLRKDLDVVDDADVLLEVARTPLTGELRIGGQAVSGSLSFQSASGADIKFVANEEGAFAGFLTGERDVIWAVRVESPTHGIERELRDVRPDFSPDGDAHVTVDLPDGHLGGNVLFQDGAAARAGWVKVTTRDGSDTLMEARIERDGRFAMNGLPVGEYSLQAHSSRDRQSMASDVVPASVGDQPTDPITLTLRAERIVRGIVLSQGQPVIGASVALMPTDKDWILLPSLKSDANGRFETSLPHGAQEVDVVASAPGFATRVFHTTLSQDLLIRLPQTGGQVHFAVPVWDAADSRMPQPWVIHDGAVVHARWIGREAWGEKKVAFEAAQLDPGVYTLCRATDQEVPRIRTGDLRGLECVSGMVPPFAHVDLALPAENTHN